LTCSRANVINHRGRETLGAVFIFAWFAGVTEMLLMRALQMIVIVLLAAACARRFP